MDKATPESAPANAEGVMAIAFELARIREEHGAQSGMYLSEVRALRANVERLAAQAAPLQQAEPPRPHTTANIEALCKTRAAAQVEPVRMLTQPELGDVALSEKVGWGPGEYVEAVQRAFCRINAGRTIPASGEIGGAA